MTFIYQYYFIKSSNSSFSRSRFAAYSPINLSIQSTIDSVLNRSNRLEEITTMIPKQNFLENAPIRQQITQVFIAIFDLSLFNFIKDRKEQHRLNKHI